MAFLGQTNNDANRPTLGTSLASEKAWTKATRGEVYRPGAVMERKKKKFKPEPGLAGLPADNIDAWFD